MPSKLSDCNDPPLPEPTEEFRAQGCGGAKKQDRHLSNEIRELRWVCETVATADGSLTAGTSIYIAGGSFLYVAHFSDRGSADVSSILDALSRSVSLNSSRLQPR